MSSSSSSFARAHAAAWAAVVDNPIVDKDGIAAMRSPRAVMSWVVSALVLGGAWLFAYASSAPTDGALRRWADWDLPGRSMLLTVVGLALGGVSLIAPVLAATSIAGERERGTLPLLTVTALGPGDLVVGKLAALVLTFLPMCALVLPLLSAATLLGGVNTTHVVVGTALVFAHGVCLLAVGVCASTVFEQARLSSIASLLVGGGVSLLCALPVYLALVEGTLHGRGALAACAATGVVVEITCAIGALLWARSNLAPRSAPRWRAARAYAAIVVVTSGPMLAVASWIARSSEDLALGVAQVGALVVPTLAGLVVTSDRRGRDAPGSLRAALTLIAAVVVSACCASLVPVSDSALDLLDASARDASGWHVVMSLAASSLVVGLSLLAAVSRLVRPIAGRVASAAAIVGVSLALPYVLAWPGMPDRASLAVWNPALALDSPSAFAAPTVLFHVVASVLLLLLAALPRKTTTHA